MASRVHPPAPLRQMEWRGMTQDLVELILGRLVTDARFRRRFFSQPAAQLEEYELVEHERDSLCSIDADSVGLLLELLAERLDPRIRRG